MWCSKNHALTTSEKNQLADMISCNADAKDIKQVVFRNPGKLITFSGYQKPEACGSSENRNTAHHGELLLQ